MLMKLMEDTSRRWDTAAKGNNHCAKYEAMKLMHLTEKGDVETYLQLLNE